MLQPIEQFRATVKFLFCDIDDTLTEGGHLLPESFAALWKLRRAGIKVVPVTGRPAGWCELIARQWPVDGVIGENGGLYFRLVGQEMVRYYAVASTSRIDNQKRLDKIRAEVLATVPGSKVASDQFCRMLDLAIDFAEDVKPALPPYAVEKIVGIFQKHGATAKVSSIHVNGWFGDYDKLKTCEVFLQKEFSINLNEALPHLAFVGDSPNDEPFFAKFPNSVGVANVAAFRDQMQHLPKFITPSPGGRGFAEFVEVALRFL
jgi:HAD superfamily hydrolase (TIGR01484 family)